MLLDKGRFAGKTSGGWLETAAGRADIFGAGVDIENALRLLLNRLPRPPQAGMGGAGLPARTWTLRRNAAFLRQRARVIECAAG